MLEELERLAPVDGTIATHVSGLSVIRQSTTTSPFAIEYKPCLCVVGQGRKQITVGDKLFSYDPLQSLVVALPLPVTARIVEASEEQPFLAAVLTIDIAEISELLVKMPAPEREPDSATAMRVSSLKPEVAEGFRRLLRAAADLTDARIIGPGLVREIYYRMLGGEQGDALRLLATRGGHAERVARAVRFVETHFEEPIDVATIAKNVGISSSRLQHVFKDVTALSPIQYLKKVRLHRARVLMLAEGMGAAEAAHRVGYGSPSQFSREFKRQFGRSPSHATRELQGATV